MNVRKVPLDQRLIKLELKGSGDFHLVGTVFIRALPLALSLTGVGVLLCG